MLNLKVNHQRAVWSAKLLKDALREQASNSDVDSTGLNNVKIVKRKSAVCLHRARDFSIENTMHEHSANTA